MSVRAVLITGGNLGDVRANLRLARERIAARVGDVTACSSVYESGPWGFEAVERFLNQVLVCDTELGPEKLLDAVQAIENELGRTRTAGEGYRSRTMDIDILFYGNEIVDTPRLKIPHPLLAQRMFVLEPLCEVLPGWVHPVSGVSVKKMMEYVETQK